MGQVAAFDELALIALLGVVVSVALARLRLPVVAGLLAAGAIVGPHGAALVHEEAGIEVLAEVGVVLLLFTIGLEFSIKRMRDIFRRAALGGFVQVALTVIVAAGIAAALGEPPGRSLFWGFVFSLSSTAIVLRALGERRELDAPHGKFIVGALIFQDLCVVPMVMLVPMLAPGDEGAGLLDVAGALATAVGVVIATLLFARWVVPRALGWVDASRSREVFLLAILAICIGTAWLTSLVGLSLALGAFLGGLVVADTEYGHRAMGDVLPLRDAFVSVFFVSLGMLFDVRVVAEQPGLVALALAGFLGAKGAIATLAALVMRFPARVAWLAGVGLAQFGEFGFVLVRIGEARGLVDPSVSRPLLAAGIISMFFAPLLVRIAPRVHAGERLIAPLARLLGVRSIVEAEEADRPLTGHVVIVGGGVAGRHAARALAACAQPFVMLEISAKIVRELRAEGVPIYYGDATSEEALRHARLPDARLLVLLIDDPVGAERVVATARRVAPEVAVVMRTHYLREAEALGALGAAHVVAEEVEGAIEVIARMLRSVGVPRNVIDARVRVVRGETDVVHAQTLPRPRLSHRPELAELRIEDAVVHAGSPAAGASLRQLALRSATGALVVAIRRAGNLREDPSADEPFAPGDVVYLVGTSDAIRAALEVFDVSA